MAGVLAAGVAAWPLWVGLFRATRYVGNGTDLYSYQFPLRRLIGAWLRTGELAFWNPYALSGIALHDAFQLGLTYPPSLAAALLCGDRASEVLLAVHVSWLAIGTSQLAAEAWLRRDASAERSWHDTIGLAVVGAVAAGCGPVWGHVFAGHVSFVQAWSWTPWLWWSTLRACRHPTLRGVALACTVAGLQTLAGHPQAVYLGAVGLLALVAVAGSRRDGREFHGHVESNAPERSGMPASVRFLAVLAAVAGGGAALSAIQWLPAAFSLEESNRSLATAHEIAFAFSAPIATLRTVFDDAALGGSSARIPGMSYHETLAFVGPAAVVLAAVGIGTHRLVGLVAAAAIGILLALSLGSHGPLLPAVVDLLPGAGTFRVPGRWLAPASLLFALTVGWALPGVARTAGRRSGLWRWCMTLLALIAMVGLARFVGRHDDDGHRRPSSALDWTADDGAILRGAVGTAHRLATAAALRQANWCGAHGVACAGGYEPAITRTANLYGNRLAGRAALAYSINLQVRSPSAWLDRAAVSHVLHDDGDRQFGQAFANWSTIAHLSGGRTLRAHPQPYSRAGIPAHVHVEPDTGTAIEMLEGLPPDTVIADRPAPVSAMGGSVQLRDIGPHHVELDVATATPALVVLRDAYHAGWHATIDGAPAEAVRVDGAYRGVVVSTGHHLVTWRFSAPGLALGATISFCAVLLMGGAVIAARNLRH